MKRVVCHGQNIARSGADHDAVHRNLVMISQSLPQEVSAVVWVRRDFLQECPGSLDGLWRRAKRVFVHPELYDRNSECALDLLCRIFGFVRGYALNMFGNKLGKAHFRNSRLS